MNPRLTVVAEERGGWFTRRDALACGYTDAQIRRRVRDKRWHRLCRGAFVEPAPGEASRPEWDRVLRRHQLTAQAVYHRLGGRAVLSHQSAVALHGLPVWGLDLDRVQLTRLSGCARADKEVQQHRLALDPAEIVERSGVRVTSVTRSVLDTACLCEYQAAVSVIDAALNRQLTTPAELRAGLTTLARRPGIGTAVNAVAFADGGSESVGESRLRVVLADQGLPAPLLQAKIVATDGEVMARHRPRLLAERIRAAFARAAKLA